MPADALPRIKDFRRRPRATLPGLVKLLWQDAGGGHRTAKARCLNISEMGMRIELHSPIPERQYIRVESGEYGLLGRASVRYCTREGIKWVAGLEFSNGMKWRPKMERSLAAAHSALHHRPETGG